MVFDLPQNSTAEYAMYLRKSRVDAEMEAQGVDTLARHEKILTDYAAAHHLRITEVYREVVSGESIESRPEMKRLLKDVRSERFRGVLVMEVERLARGDTKDQGTVAEAFKYSETLIVTPHRVYDPNNEADEEYFEFGLFMSRREYKTIRRRMQSGIRQSITEGNFLGSVPPYGYDIVTHGRRNRTLVPNAEADTVRMIFDWYTVELLSIAQIIQRLAAMGIPTQKGGSEWNSITINRMLVNPAYIGKVTYGRYRDRKEFSDGSYVTRVHKSAEGDYIIADGKHPPLISPETFQAAAKRMEKPIKIKADTVLHNPLSGLIFCGICGNQMHYKIHASDHPEWTRYVHRRKTTCPNSHGSANAAEVMAAVQDALESALRERTLLLSDNTELRRREADTVSKMESNIAALERKKSRLYTLLEDGIYSQEEFVTRRAALNEELANLQSQLAAARNSQSSILTLQRSTALISEALTSLTAPDSNAAAINHFLKQCVKSITYTRFSVNEPFALDVDLL